MNATAAALRCAAELPGPSWSQPTLEQYSERPQQSDVALRDTLAGSEVEGGTSLRLQCEGLQSRTGASWRHAQLDSVTVALLRPSPCRLCTTASASGPQCEVLLSRTGSSWRTLDTAG